MKTIKYLDSDQVRTKKEKKKPYSESNVKTFTRKYKKEETFLRLISHDKSYESEREREGDGERIVRTKPCSEQTKYEMIYANR